MDTEAGLFIYQIFKQSLHPKRLTHIVLLTIFLLACSNPDFLYQLFSVHFANYAQTECQFRYCGTAIPFLTVRST
ncbi:hypothetical protein, partial [Mediterraneibacter gnavus]|uniref:hypothetical protein n=1 Tax=Mediterraneibacter gnavus TaxID=33038 RepID=UPI00374EF428